MLPGGGVAEPRKFLFHENWLDRAYAFDRQLWQENISTVYPDIFSYPSRPRKTPPSINLLGDFGASISESVMFERSYTSGVLVPHNAYGRWRCARLSDLVDSATRLAVRHAVRPDPTAVHSGAKSAAVVRSPFCSQSLPPRIRIPTIYTYGISWCNCSITTPNHRHRGVIMAAYITRTSFLAGTVSRIILCWGLEARVSRSRIRQQMLERKRYEGSLQSEKSNRQTHLLHPLMGHLRRWYKRQFLFLLRMRRLHSLGTMRSLCWIFRLSCLQRPSVLAT